MQFLKTIFWVALAVLGVIFSVNNWTAVTLNLWSGLQVDTYLPILLLVAFVLGFVPYFVLHRATRWSLNRRLTSAERSLTEYRDANRAPGADGAAQPSSTMPPPPAPPR